MLDDEIPMDGEKAAALANQLLECCYAAHLNRLELLTALGMVVDRAVEDVPQEFVEGWIRTVRRHAGFPSA